LSSTQRLISSDSLKYSLVFCWYMKYELVSTKYELQILRNHQLHFLQLQILFILRNHVSIIIYSYNTVSDHRSVLVKLI